MTIIFDLDYTLLDTKKFKQGLAHTLDLSVADFEKSYFENFKNKKINYSLDKHLAILNKKSSSIKIENFLKKSRQYLFPESLNILQKLKSSKTKNKLILLSFGNIEWQKQKIDSLDIGQYFDKIILTDKSKAKELKQFKDINDNILIVNDNAREILEMKKIINNCNILLTKGPYSDNIEHDIKIQKLSLKNFNL